MPVATPIGNGLGIRRPCSLMIIREAEGAPNRRAGMGTASDAALATALGLPGPGV